MNYLDFYEMRVEPFSNAPVSRFFYNSAPHAKALVRLMYAIESMKGLAVLVGEIGSGKTTLARRLLDNLPEEEFEAALLVIIHSGIDAQWLLKRIAMQLGVEDPAEERLKLLAQLYQRLVEIHETGRKAVVLIDEAQMLKSREVMEEFRGLLNLELPEKKLLNIVFFGLPSLEEGLALDPPLAQRIAVKYHLGSLDAEATENYIKHRLRLAGAKRMLFTREASESVFFFSKGIPRLINTICDNALFEGAMIKSSLIEEPLIQNVCKDLGLDREMSAPQNGGTRASDFVTPHEMQNYGSPPPYQERPAGIIGRRAVDRALPAEPISERRHSPVEMEKVQEPRSFETSEEDSPSSKPLMDEIDGILDNLIDKV